MTIADANKIIKDAEAAGKYAFLIRRANSEWAVGVVGKFIFEYPIEWDAARIPAFRDSYKMPETME